MPAVGGRPRKVYAPESARVSFGVDWSADGTELAVTFGAPEGWFIDIFSLPSHGDAANVSFEIMLGQERVS